MKLLNVDAEAALTVQDHLSENGFDFSECSQREFNQSVRSAYDEISTPSQTWLMRNPG
jgi:hypothetical protein